MPKPARAVLTLALTALLGPAYAGQSALQTAEALAAQRSAGTNAKLDNRLLGLKRQARKPAAKPSSASTRVANTAGASSAGEESYVAVDIIAKGDPQALKAKLEKLGFKTSAIYRDDIGGQLPVSQIDNAAALDDVLRIGAPQKYTRAGSIEDQGDFVQHSRLVRATVATAAIARSSRPRYVDGSGLTIGVISDSFDCFGQHNRQQAGKADWVHQTDQDDDTASGDLPKGVRVVQEAICFDRKGKPAGTDEGRAMAQIIHDVAPGAKIAFYSPDSMADFAQGIQTLALPTNKTDAKGRPGAGAQIVVDDLGFYGEPLYQEGIIGEAIDEVSKKQGVAYFTAAGNASFDDPTLSAYHGAYDNNAAAFLADAVTKAKGATVLPANLNERLLNFDASGVSTIKRLPVAIAGNADQVTATFLLYWDQPMTGSKGASSSLELCLTDADGNPLQNSTLSNADDESDLLCSGPSGVGQPAQSILQVVNAAGASRVDAYLQVGLVEQGEGKLPGRVHILSVDNAAVITRYGTHAGTIYGHPLSPYAAAIGAADYFQTPDCSPQLVDAALESYSSYGYTPILFDPDGKPVAKPAIPRKPDFVAPDGASTTFFGYDSSDPAAAKTTNASCRSTDYHFYGTSAAAPHAAAAAALLKQAEPAATRADLLDAIEQSTQEMYVPGFDYRTGYGFLQADAAYAKLKSLLQDRREKASARTIDGLPRPQSMP